jgi:hypothetical protein
MATKYVLASTLLPGLTNGFLFPASARTPYRAVKIGADVEKESREEFDAVVMKTYGTPLYLLSFTIAHDGVVYQVDTPSPW